MGGGGQEAEVLVTIADNVDVEEVSSDSDFEPVVAKFGTASGEDNGGNNANNNNKKDKDKKDKDKANKAATTSETLSFVFHDGELKTKLIFTIGFLAAIGNGLVRI
jgi:ribosomal protein L12E/L44/L45/RPP1/RPP2